MDNSKWAFAPDTPDWPIDAQGREGEGRSADQHVRLHRRRGYAHLPFGGLSHPLLQVF